MSQSIYFLKKINMYLYYQTSKKNYQHVVGPTDTGIGSFKQRSRIQDLCVWKKCGWEEPT